LFIFTSRVLYVFTDKALLLLPTNITPVIRNIFFIAGILIILFSCHNNADKPEHYLEFVALNKINNYLINCRAYPQMVVKSNEGKIFLLEITAEAGCFTNPPEEINNLKDLEILTINNTTLRSIPYIDSLTNLASLDLYINNIEGVVTIPASLQRLAMLNLSSNKISDVQFEDHMGIVNLGLFNNKLTSLNPSINKLKELEKLFLSNNQIQDVDLTGLPNLIYVDLTDNPVDSTAIKLRHANTKIQFKFGNTAR